MFNIRDFLGLGYYISELDQFLQDYRKKHHELSTSQRIEQDKHRVIGVLRDQPCESSKSHENLWD